MGQRETATGERVHVGAFVDREQRRQLVEHARREDRSVSAVVRRALQAELERQEPRPSWCR
jgi:post-segregation antitoxin (ccd killing protein)